MNKYLLLSAAAALASTSANAGTAVKSFQFGTASGGSYCDGGTLYTSGSSVWSWQHTNANCYGFVSYGQGLKGTQAGVKGADMSDTFFGAAYGIFSEYVSFMLPKKIKNGEQWQVWLGINGTTSFLANAGPLINVSKNTAHVTKSKTSTMAQLKDYISLHKKSK
jgi:hypothetical protein